jgi:hypothetical protein
MNLQLKGDGEGGGIRENTKAKNDIPNLRNRFHGQPQKEMS